MKMIDNKVIIYFIAIVLFFSLLFVPKVEVVAASTKPKDISITFSKDSLTEKNFTWLTENSTPIPTVLEVWKKGGKVLTFGGSSEIYSAHLNYYADTSQFNGKKNQTTLNIHKASATGLKPDTTYYYRCGDGINKSDTGTFKTGIQTGSFSFIYMTDPQSVTDSNFALWKRCAEHSILKFPEAKFFTVAGDLTDRGSSENLWDKFFDYGNKLTSNLTIVPAIGNHETDTGPHIFEQHFYFPTNNDNLPDYVYSFDYSNAHFMVLTTEMTYAQLTSKDANVKEKADSLLNNQADWLRKEVKNSNKKWNIVILHKSFYAAGAYYNDKGIELIENKLAPVFDELSIDAVLSGHDHTYSTSFLYGGQTVSGVTKDSKTIAKDKGTFYLRNNAAGPKFYDITQKTKFSKLLKYGQPKKQMFTGVTVDDRFLKFDTYTVDSDTKDNLYDSVTILKK